MVKQDIDKLLTIGFIQSIKEATWLSPIVVVPKNNGKLKIYIDFKELNVATKKDPYPLPFIDEVLNTIARYEAYSFLNGYSRYHLIFIAPKDRYNTTLVIEWGALIWKVMPFRMKCRPLTYQKVVTKAFREYLDDFTVYSDMESHLQKFKLCFQKCREYGISLNLDKCAFMVFSGMILVLLFPKKGNY
jgi:hypothetical protein